MSRSYWHTEVSLHRATDLTFLTGHIRPSSRVWLLLVSQNMCRKLLQVNNALTVQPLCISFRSLLTDVLYRDMFTPPMRWSTTYTVIEVCSKICVLCLSLKRQVMQLGSDWVHSGGCDWQQTGLERKKNWSSSSICGIPWLITALYKR